MDAGGLEQSVGPVLVLGTDDRVVLAIARSLGRQGLVVHLGWCSASSIAARSKYVAKVHAIPPYSADDDRWKTALIELLTRESFQLVIPCNDSTLVPLVTHRRDFARWPQLHLLPDEVFSVVSDKFNTYRLAVEQGVQVPRGRVVDASADCEQLIREFDLPLVVKPQASVTAARTDLSNVVKKVRTRDELAAALNQRTRPVLVQENFDGHGVGIEMLLCEGKILYAFQHQRIHETVEWGSSYRKSVPVSSELLAASQKLMQAIGYTGVAMAEFIVNPRTGRWVFLEINGRFWGSLPLAVAAGADFPYYLYQMLIEGKREFPTRYRTGVQCRNLPLDWYWLRSRAKDSTLAKFFLPFRASLELASAVIHRDHLDSLSQDDPRPFFAELRQMADRRLQRIYRPTTSTAPTANAFEPTRGQSWPGVSWFTRPPAEAQ